MPVNETIVQSHSYAGLHTYVRSFLLLCNCYRWWWFLGVTWSSLSVPPTHLHTVPRLATLCFVSSSTTCTLDSCNTWSKELGWDYYHRSFLVDCLIDLSFIAIRSEFTLGRDFVSVLCTQLENAIYGMWMVSFHLQCLGGKIHVLYTYSQLVVEE